MGVLIGVGLPIAIMNAFTAESIWTAIGCAAFVLQSLNFFHGKVSTLDDADYSTMLRANPRIALADYALNMSIAVAFAVVGVVIADPLSATIANLVLRIVDVPLVLVGIKATFSANVLRAHRSWLTFDISSVVVWIAVLFVVIFCPAAAAIVFGGSYILIAVADIVMDYTYNADLYFRPPNTWNAYVQTWDELQGRDGDSVRANVVAPALLARLHQEKAISVLEMGSGNGAIARHLARDGFEVVANEGSALLVEAARSYQPLANLSYGNVGFADTESIERIDAVVVVQSHHAAGDLSAVFDAVYRVLRWQGVFLLIDEDAASGELPEEPYRWRRWQDREYHDGARRQLVFWRRPGAADAMAVTSATYWTDATVIEAAAKQGLVLETGPIRLDTDSLPASVIDDVLRLYARRPYLRLWVFRGPRRPR